MRSIRRLKTTSTATKGLTDTGRLFIDSIKRRSPKKKTLQSQQTTATDVDGLCERPVVALSTADEYNLDDFGAALVQHGLYEQVRYDDTIQNELNGQVLHMTAKYKLEDENRRDFFVFDEGSIVFWNMSASECGIVLKLLREFETKPYEQDIVNEEREEIDVVLTRSPPSRLSRGLIYLNMDNEPNAVNLDKFAFSNAIALSVKLSIWEANLDRYIDSIEYITQDMKEGRKIKLTRDEVFRKTGQLFGLRHRLNLSSDMLDTPDFYWDREELERLFTATYLHLNINKRTRVMNEKLNHCIELMDLLSSHLNDIHHVRLEWMIIILIMIEVVFEVIHYIERFAIPV